MNGGQQRVPLTKVVVFKNNEAESDESEDDQTEDDVRIAILIADEDVNADGSVNIIDLLIVLSHRGENVKDFPDYDVNGDGTIDNEDVVEVLKNFDVGAAPQATADNSSLFGELLKKTHYFLTIRIRSIQRRGSRIS